MKRFATVILSAALTAGLALAAGIDGKWVSETKRTNQDGQEMVIKITMNLKAEGTNITGSVTMPSRGGEERTTEIKEGKLEGSNFSFATVMETQRGSFKTTYEGTLEGDTLKGTIKRTGGQREMPPTPFEAKRAQ